jgi:hypothetical protein
MTYSSLDTDFLDGDRFTLDGVILSPAQIDRAVQISQSVTDTAQQWSAYLNALGLLGFEQWLQERADDLVIRSDRCSLLQTHPYLTEVVCNLEVNAFKVCLIAMGSLTDTVITIPATVLDTPELAAQLYVVLDVQEEQDQVAVKAFLRSDQLMQHTQAQSLQVGADQSYTLPLTWFDFDSDNLLLYFRCLEPTALPVSNGASALVTEIPEEEIAHPAATQATPSRLLNVACWLRDQLDAAAQELAWVLLPPPTLATQMRSTSLMSARNSAAEQFERLLNHLQQSGVNIPTTARGAYRDLHWGGVTLRLYAMTWLLPQTTTTPEWTLLMIVGAEWGAPLPAGVRLRIQDEDQLLVDRGVAAGAQDTFLYARVIGTWNEQFWVTIDMSNGAIVTLPPFSFRPEA